MINIAKKINIEFLIGFLLVGGTSFVMQLFFYFQGYDNSTNIVVALKLVISFLVIYYVVRYKPRIVKKKIFFIFVFFWILWYIRLYYDAFVASTSLGLPVINYYAFSVLSAIVPFFYGNLLKSDKSINNLVKGIVIGLFSLSILTFIFFRNIQEHRVGSEDGSVSSLVISYTAAMLVAYYIWKSVEKFRLIYLVPIIMGIVLLGIGASKGSVVTLFFSLMFVLILQKKMNSKTLVLFGLLFIIIQYSNLVSFEVLMGRFETSLNRNFESNDKEIRYYLWQYSVEKFIDNPILGHSLEIRGSETLFLSGENAYPHNIILEAFLSTGFLGGLLFLALIILTFKNAIVICKKEKENGWILLFFLLALFQYMVSGKIYNAVWFWFFVGLVHGRYTFIELSGCRDGELVQKKQAAFN